ncbi:hypothetical protein PG987_013047 [Apiospora arundinis]
MSSSNSTTPKPVAPKALCHVVLITTQANFEKMVNFYLTVLNATVSHQTDRMCFLSYDYEHHRIAIVVDDNAHPKDPARPQVVPGGGPGGGIKPYWCVNHGVTMSMYYQDPDGNRIEFQVDSFDTADEARAYMVSPAFVDNPIGVEFDPDEFVRRVRSGTEDEAAIKARPDMGKRDTIVYG